MKVIAVTMVRDEADIIDWTISHLLDQGVDHVVVADNMSLDDTGWMLRQMESSGRVTVLDDDEVGYRQDAKMTGLAHFARDEFGADWVLPFDADEYWYSPTGTLAEFFANCEGDIVRATGWDHVVTDDDDPTEHDPFRRIAHRRLPPQRLGKVAFRWAPSPWIDFGNHDVFNHPGMRVTGLNYRHYQWRSFEQMVNKARNGAAAMDAAGLHPTYGAHWRSLARLDDANLWAEWRRLCEEPGLIEDPAR